MALFMRFVPKYCVSEEGKKTSRLWEKRLVIIHPTLQCIVGPHDMYVVNESKDECYVTCDT